MKIKDVLLSTSGWWRCRYIQVSKHIDTEIKGSPFSKILWSSQQKVRVGSDNGLAPNSNKTIFEPMAVSFLTHISVTRPQSLIATECCLWAFYSWWRHQMEIFSTLLALCVGTSPATGEFPAQWPATRSFDVFFDVCLNKRLSKQYWGWWFETQSRSLWRHFTVCAESS